MSLGMIWFALKQIAMAEVDTPTLLGGRVFEELAAPAQGDSLLLHCNSPVSKYGQTN